MNNTTYTASHLFTALRVIFALQAQEAEQRIVQGNLNTPDLTPWIERMAKVAVPFLQEYYREGMRRVAVQLGISAIQDHLQQEKPYTIQAVSHGPTHYDPIHTDEHGGRRYYLPLVKRLTPVILKTVQRSAEAILHRGRTAHGFNPKVIDAVNQAALHFCRETLETATTDVDVALEGVRIALRRHLRYSTRYGSGPERGEYRHILRSLASRIGRIFNDPYRAYRIANTEYQRAINAGALLEARAAPFATIKVWRSSVGCCKKCKALNGKRRKLELPFIILPDPGPYSRILHPPYHPNCECKMEIRKSRGAM